MIGFATLILIKMKTFISRDIDDRSFQHRRSEPPDWHPPRYDHHTIRGNIHI